MTKEEHLLVIAMEECNEVAQRLSKALRFGMEQIQQDIDDKPEENPSKLTNKQRIHYEYCQLVAVMEMLNIFPNNDIYINEKKKKIEKYLLKSKELGKLD